MINLQPSIFLPSVQLTANGVVDMGCAPSNILSLKVDGVFGGASVEIGYVSDNGAFNRYSDIPVTTGNLQLANLLLAFWSSIAVRVANATATTNVRVHWYPHTYS